MGKNKNIYIYLIVVLLLVMTIGYALLNSTLNITGKSNISKNTWDVHFDNVVVKNGSAEAVKLPTIENNTTVDFEVALNMPGEFYGFTVDVVNNGTIDAMIDSIENLPELTLEQQKYLNYIIEYENGEQITTKQLVSKESFVRLKVKVELRKDIAATDLPEVGDVLYLSFTLNYVQADNNGVSVKDDGVKAYAISYGDVNEIGTVVTIGDQEFYVVKNEGNNVHLLSMYNLYVNGKYDEASSNLILYGDDATGMQSPIMRGVVSDGVENRNGVVAFSSDLQKGTNYSSYEGSIVEGYVNNYKTLLETNFEIPIIGTRLMTQEELNNTEIFACYRYNCSSMYRWINSTSYWTQTPYGSSNLIAVNNATNYNGETSYNIEHAYGVRPVIVISKDFITRNKANYIEFTVDGINYIGEENMTWGEWISSYYSQSRFKIDNGYVASYPSIGLINLCLTADDVIDNGYAYETSPTISFWC